jgi:hypothetical protein
VRKYARMVADYREFTREMMARSDRTIVWLDRRLKEEREQLAEIRRENREYFAVLHAQAKEEAARTDEIIAEMRAQRQALLSILDRLDNGGAAPATS